MARQASNASSIGQRGDGPLVGRIDALDAGNFVEGRGRWRGRDAVESDLLGVPIQVCSLARLREMKEAQGRTQDRADLENLPTPEDVY